MSTGAARRVLPWLREGVRVQWVDNTPPDPFVRLSAPVLDPEHRSFVNEELLRLLGGGMLREIPREDAFVSCKARVEPKRDSDKLRLVVNYRGPVNQRAVKRGIRLETLATLPAVLRRGDFMVTLDLRSGYHHFRFHADSQRYLGFNIMDRFFEPVALNFGFTQAPWIFHKIMREVVRHLRANHGVRVLSYLDDFLLLGDSREEALRARDTTLQVFDDLGLQVAHDKGQWEPAQTATFLGVEVSSEPPLFRAPEAKVERVAAEARDLLARAEANGGWVSVRQLQRTLGLMAFLDRTLRPCRLHTRELFNATSRSAYRHAKRGWPRGRAPITDQAAADLRWWAELPSSEWVRRGRLIFPPSLVRAVRVFTDASGRVGWGAASKDGTVLARGTWSAADSADHITVKEMKAVMRSLQAQEDTLRGRRVLVLCDNAAVVRIITKGASKSPELMQCMRELFRWAVEHGVQLHAKWVPTDANPADAPSRRLDVHGQQLAREVFERLDDAWGPHDVDCFASAANAQLPAFYAWDHDPTAAGTPDAFTNDWSRNQNNWVYPPFPLVSRALQHVRECQATATLIVPDWPAQPWHARLLAEAQEVRRLDQEFPHLRVADLHTTPSGCRSFFGSPTSSQATWTLLAVRLSPETSPSPRPLGD